MREGDDVRRERGEGEKRREKEGGGGMERGRAMG